MVSVNEDHTLWTVESLEHEDNDLTLPYGAVCCVNIQVWSGPS